MVIIIEIQKREFDIKSTKIIFLVDKKKIRINKLFKKMKHECLVEYFGEKRIS